MLLLRGNVFGEQHLPYKSRDSWNDNITISLPLSLSLSSQNKKGLAQANLRKHLGLLKIRYLQTLKTK